MSFWQQLISITFTYILILEALYLNFKVNENLKSQGAFSALLTLLLLIQDYSV